MHSVRSLRGEIFEILCEVIDQRRCSMVSNSVFARRHHSRLHQFASAFQFIEYRPSRAFISATGRDRMHQSRAVAVLGDVGSRLDDDAL